MSAPTDAPRGVRVVRADGSITPVDVAFIGTEPKELDGEIYVVNRYAITTQTFIAAGDRIDADHFPEGCTSFVAMHVGAL